MTRLFLMIVQELERPESRLFNQCRSRRLDDLALGLSTCPLTDLKDLEDLANVFDMELSAREAGKKHSGKTRGSSNG